jgi:C1A family cysteine protease
VPFFLSGVKSQDMEEFIKDVRLGWHRQSRDGRDLLFRPTAVVLPASVDLTQTYSVPVVDQGNLGSCTGNGIAAALAYLQLQEKESMVFPSRLFIYYNERVIENSVSQDAGADIRDGIKSVVSQGYCAEADWPYDITQFATQPSATAYADAIKEEVKTYQAVNVDPNSVMQALASGFPVVVGFDVYSSFMNAPGGDVPMPGSGERLEGGHCFILVGYDQATQRFKFQNSWGSGWGQSGFGTIPFAYLPHGSDFWVITGDSSTPTPGPTPDPGPTPAPASRKGCFGWLSGLFGSGGG